MRVPRRMEGWALVFTFFFLSRLITVLSWGEPGLACWRGFREVREVTGFVALRGKDWRTGDLKETFLNEGWISHISLPRHCIAGQYKMTFWHTVVWTLADNLAILVSYFILSILSGNQVISCNIISYFFSKVILCQWEHFFKLEIGFETKH